MESVDICVRRAQNGDLNAYSELVRAYQDMAVAYAHHLLRDVHLAEDAAQEAFIQVYLHLNDLRQPAAFGAWLRKLVFKYCDRITRRRAMATTSLDNVPEPISQTSGPDEWVEQAEMNAKLRQAIRILPETQRLVTTLFYLGEYSQHHIGEQLNIPTQTVKSRLHTARKRLRKELLAMTEDRFVKTVIDKIKIVAHEGKYYPSEKVSNRAHIQTMSDYEHRYRESIEQPEVFWAQIAEDFHWFQPWKQVREFNYDLRLGPIKTQWFSGAIGLQVLNLKK